MKRLFFCILVLNFSCVKEKTTAYTATVHNPTQHSITCLYWKNGQVSDKIQLEETESFELADGYFRGIVGQVGFIPNFIGDSVLVIFDDSISTMHYLDIDMPTHQSYYLYQSSRNLQNKLSYEYSYYDVSKYSRVSQYDYYFTEQDYMDAK